jgi:hypothetical protein
LGYLTKLCETRGGSGRVTPEPRRNDAGEVDPFDILGKFEALCGCCNRSGEVVFDPKSISEQVSGHVAEVTGK